jgi:superfamily II DNA helicase RecQ
LRFIRSNVQPIARYYPEWLTKLLITYLYIVVPFHELLDPVDFAKNPYLFGRGKSGHWSVTDQTAALEKFSTQYLDFRLNTERWRQIQTNLDAYFVHSNLSGDDEDDEVDLIADLQAAHSTKMAKTHYGRTGTGLDVRSRRDFRRNSELWHKWFGLTQRRPKSSYPPTIQASPRVDDVESKVKAAMTQLYGSAWTWKHPQQQDSVLAIAQGEPYVVSILPTDAGKTTLILIPALIDPNLTQVVITPYVPLAENLIERCRDLSIDCLRWTAESRVKGRSASIVVVVVDTAMKPEFTMYLRDLDLQSKLGHIFIDEAHAYLTEREWRPVMTKIYDLTLPARFVFMTATLPPSMEPAFEQAFTLDKIRPTYVRGSCIRKKIRYSVESVSMSLDEAAIQLIRSEQGRLSLKEKILVFCPSIVSLKYISKELNCGMYASKDVDKDEALLDWKRGVYPTLCSTSALGAGMDIPDVVLVVHVGFMFEMFTFQQGAGRGGRGGKESRSITLMEESWFDQPPTYRDSGKKALTSYLKTNICRQQELNRFFNGVEDTSVTCTELGSVPCDLCEARKCWSVVFEMPRIAKHCLDQEDEMQDDQELKRAKLMQREEEILKKKREEARLESLVRSTVDRLQSQCYHCWLVYEDDEVEAHAFSECEFKPRYSAGEQVDLRRKGVVENHACFNCGLPCDYCEEYGSGGAISCRKQNVIWFVVQTALNMQEWKKEFDEWMEGREGMSEREVDLWMVKSRSVLGKKSTNVFYAFVQICKWFC